MSKTRIERDSMGEVRVPVDALYGAQTQRAVNNFAISEQPMPSVFINGLLILKLTAARANEKLECLSTAKANAIVNACQTLLVSDDFMDHFPVGVFQTGSGTSSNMNANEVIARLAMQQSGVIIDPNDDVNFGQSSNDVIPSTIHISAALALNNTLMPALDHLLNVLKEKAGTLSNYCKTGRTHLMDAMPIRFDQVIMAWHNQIEKNQQNLQKLQPNIQALAQGGTAVGTGVNAHPEFAVTFAEILSEITGLKFTPADNFFAAIGSQDTAVALSGQLKTTAVSMMKIANDLRWMNSGPLAGLGEITLEALQPGSSIMPGKINPVIPEAAAMVSAQVIGNDAAITIGGQSGNFELNVMLPMIANNLLQSISLLANTAISLADKAIVSFVVNEDNITSALYKNPILVTALNPVIGYSKAAEIAKKAYAEKRSVVDVAEELSGLSRQELEVLLDPNKLTFGGI
ncbi:MAG: fumarate hydratase class II [Pseudohongiellaceae bacterium]|jgi:fumarate hydratase class II